MLKFLPLSFICLLLVSPTYAMWSKDSCLTATTIIFTTAEVTFQKSNPLYEYIIGTGLLWVEKDFWHLFCISHGPYSLQGTDIEDDGCLDTLVEIDEEVRKVLEGGIEFCEDGIHSDECFKEILRIREMVMKKAQSCKRLMSNYQLSYT